ncbi:acyltransferase [Rheinheimera baltica]|uniref:acyltransferase family protein n=1 Tax=Rheinheimera baltica TaxID=67576 RepID=UPI00273EC8BD|nr:acyltransferase [Rheinheimera baltica]MDP5142037.1 acyltransferase [Rheinheimera baltica]
MLEKTTSLYLDFLRLLSALLVFAYHARAERLNGQWIGVVGNFGHDAVIVFFVLSGFVIAYTTARKPADINSFIKSRLARLYSVAVPALIFTVLADYIGQYFNPSIYITPYYEDSQPLARFVYNLLFINEIWHTSWRAFSNGPFWSLSYEFFYYLIFALAFYLKGWRRLLYVALAALVAGPKILILLPTWLVGVLLFHLNKNITLRFSFSLFLMFGSIVLYSAYRLSGLPNYLYNATKELIGKEFILISLDMSRWFLNDYIVSMLVAMNILGTASILRYISINHRVSFFIRYFAGMTFTLYLFHYPLLQLFGSTLSNNVIIVTLSLASVMIIAPVTEGSKTHWLRLFNRIHQLLRKPTYERY